MSLCSRKANIFLDEFGRFASDSIELETDSYSPGLFTLVVIIL